MPFSASEIRNYTPSPTILNRMHCSGQYTQGPENRKGSYYFSKVKGSFYFSKGKMYFSEILVLTFRSEDLEGANTERDEMGGER